MEKHVFSFMETMELILKKPHSSVALKLSSKTEKMYLTIFFTWFHLVITYFLNEIEKSIIKGISVVGKKRSWR